MANICCYPGCQNSRRTRNSNHVSLHAFPSDPLRCEAWIRSIPRKNFKPSKESRLCGLHFRSKDFVKVDIHPKLIDSESEMEGESLLKAHAVPITSCGSSSNLDVESNPDLFYLRDFEDLLRKSSQIQLPPGYIVFQRTGVLNIASFEKNRPKILNILVIKEEDLSFEMWDGTLRLSNEKVSDIVKDPSRISCVLDIENILLYLSISSECSTEENMVEKCASILEAQEYTEERDSRLVSFIVEQLRLLLKRGSSRRYSKALLETSARWERSSPAFYRMLREEDSFILPRPSYLSRLATNGEEEDLPSDSESNATSSNSASVAMHS